MRITTRKVRRLGLLVAAALILGANATYAGEVTGKGKVVPGGVNGKSLCSFSGQQDDAEEDRGFFAGDRVQSWGQVVVAVIRGILAEPWAPGPGVTCRGGGPSR